MSKKLILPLVESLITANSDVSFSRVKIIGVQHILETTHSMFQSLFKLGLKPENVSLLGKCYSTCEEVFYEMLSDGIDVSIDSFSYSSHLSYDELFEMKIGSFISSRIEALNSDDCDCILVLDDGGKCINYINSLLKFSVPIIAIEQTSAGYEAIRSQSLQFPVINVARSPLKLTLESPMIAQAAAERLYSSLLKKEIEANRALIVGGGAIGQALKRRLSHEMNVAIYDQNSALSDCGKSSLEEIIPAYPLIIGCTGKTSVPQKLHSMLAPGTVLVSVSSSDREFDAHQLRKYLPESNLWHVDLEVNNLLLINSGFPVNFDGERENIEPELIQLTIALISGALIQARRFFSSLSPGIIELDVDIENKIKSEFISDCVVSL